MMPWPEWRLPPATEVIRDSGRRSFLWFSHGVEITEKGTLSPYRMLYAVCRVPQEAHPDRCTTSDNRRKIVQCSCRLARLA